MRASQGRSFDVAYVRELTGSGCRAIVREELRIEAVTAVSGTRLGARGLATRALTSPFPARARTLPLPLPR